MRRHILSYILFLLFAGTALMSAEKPKPVIDGAEGKQAFDDLGKFYSESNAKPDPVKAVAKLSDPDKTARSAAGQYILALLMQSFADESNGRSLSRKTPFFGGGSVNDARVFRKELGAAFGKSASSEEALAAALWLLDKEMLAENQAAGMTALRRIKSPGATDVFKSLLTQPHPNAAVVQGVIEEIAARELKVLAPEISRLCLHYRQSVRDAAAAALPKLAVDKKPVYSPEAAFTPWLDTQLHSITAMVLNEIPRDAPFQRFTVEVPSRRGGDKPDVREFSGWLLKDDNGTLRTLNTFGEVSVYKKELVKTTPHTLGNEAAALIAIRTGGKDQHDVKSSLSRQGGLTGQFEPGFISVPEALVGAWSFVRGDKKTAAELLFPRIDTMADDRWLVMAVRDLIGNHYHQEMLNIFSHERDYGRVLELATHLSKPVFKDFNYQSRAKEIAEQLAKRSDDFKTFVLPEPGAWETQTKTIDRPGQIKFFAEHLRLLNCIQMGQPGGVSYSDPQSSKPRHDQKTTDSKAVINPYVELKKMKLNIADLPALVPYLADENYMPTFSYWRDFHPARTLHQVNWVVAELINDAAKRDLADLRKYAEEDADGKKQHIEHILEFCKQNAGKTREQLLLEIVGQSKLWREVGSAASEAAHLHLPGALPALIKRATDFTDNQGDIAELSFNMKDPEAVDAARSWIKQTGGKNNDSVRFWSALILLRDGDKAHLEGLAELRPLLEKDDGSSLYPQAIESLLATKNDEAAALASGILKKPRFDLGWSNTPILHRLLLAGRDEALIYLTERLDSTKSSGTSSGTWKGTDVQRKIVEGDNVAGAIERLRSDKYSYPSLAPDDERTAARKALKIWLQDQFVLLKAGKKSQIKEQAEPIRVSRWQIDAP